MRSGVMVWVMFCACALVWGQQAAVSGVDEDVAILRQAYEQMHPGLYRYSTRAEMDADFEVLRGDLHRAVTPAEQYVAFSVFAAKIRCGHTYPNFFNQSKAIAESLLQTPTRVPFYFVWRDGEMVVTQDFTVDHALARGTRVVAIGGVASKAILAKMMTVARADGANDAKRVSLMEVTGDSVYEAFDVYLPMLFPRTGATMELRAIAPGETKAHTLPVAALTYAQRIAPIKAKETAKQGSDAVFEWKEMTGGTDYLRMPTWALYNSKWDWKGWLNARMDEAVEKKAGALIVDLRGNEGGDDVGSELLKRLVVKDERIPTNQRMVRYRQAPVELSKYLETWDPSFKDWGKAAVEMSSPLATTPAAPYLALVQPGDDPSGVEVIARSAKPFTGKVIVLIDASNSSATFQFDQAMRELHRGTLVGETTGGSRRGINGGAFFFVKLPHTGIEMDLPLIGYFPRVVQKDEGIVPDVVVRDGVGDVAGGRDGVLEEAVKLAGR